jgi:hypothetical protein
MVAGLPSFRRIGRLGGLIEEAVVDANGESENESLRADVRAAIDHVSPPAHAHA